MGALASILAIALAPIVVIFSLVFMLDRYEREPIKYLVLSFIFGILIAFPVVLVELYLQKLLSPELRLNAVIFTALSAGFVVALPEEGFKYIILRLYNYPKEAFNEPYDGIMYAVAVSMGFAAIENVLYTFEHGMGTGILRAFTAVPAHAAFAHIMGYYVGKAKFVPQRGKRIRLMLLGLGGAVLTHGLYDFFLMYDNASWGIFTFIVLIIAIILAIHAIRAHQRNSPFREE